MKNVLIILIILIMFTLSGCNKNKLKQEIKEPDSNIVKEDKNEIIGDELDISNKEVDGGNIPDGVYKVSVSKFLENWSPNTFNEEDYLKERDGFISAKLDSNGVLVVEIEEWKQKEISESLKSGLEVVLDGLVTNGDTPFIKNVVTSEDYREIILLVDKKLYENNNHSFIPFIITAIGSYQTYANLGYDVSIIIKDITDNEILLSEHYPSTLEEELREKNLLEEKKKQEILKELRDKYGDLSEEELLEKSKEEEKSKGDVPKE